MEKNWDKNEKYLIWEKKRKEKGRNRGIKVEKRGGSRERGERLY